MAKTFRAWEPEQRWLLPPAIEEFVPPGHLAHFVRELVREELDLSGIVEVYDDERGQPPYHPVMMTALLLYAYGQGVYASRRIAQACEQRLDFMAVTALAQPDFRTISDFRKRHLAGLSGLFTQVLKLCAQAGLVKLGHVALDGTKIKANASKHKAMSYGRMKQAEAALAAEVAGWLERAAAADAADDAALGVAQRGDELPAWVREKQERLAKIRAAKAALEAEAAQARAARDDDRLPPDAPPPTPPDKAQRNFTDPDSRIMKGPDGRTGRGDAATPAPRGVAEPLPTAQGNGGAGVRDHETRPGLPAVPPARCHEGRGRVEPCHHGAQPAQVGGRMGLRSAKNAGIRQRAASGPSLGDALHRGERRFRLRLNHLRSE